jgi:hypothetical protein
MAFTRTSDSCKEEAYHNRSKTVDIRLNALARHTATGQYLQQQVD